METKLEKEVRCLRIYAVVATLFCAIFLLSGFVMQSKKQKFKEIDVERINIMEKDGKLKMVISNAQRQHPGSVDRKIIPRQEGRPAGMIFFNERGDEVGGLIFSGDTGKERFGSRTFDKFRGDQTIAFGTQRRRDDVTRSRRVQKVNCLWVYAYLGTSIDGLSTNSTAMNSYE